MIFLLCRDAVLFHSSQTALDQPREFPRFVRCSAALWLSPHQAHNPVRLMPAVYHHHAQMWYSVQVSAFAPSVLVQDLRSCWLSFLFSFNSIVWSKLAALAQATTSVS